MKNNSSALTRAATLAVAAAWLTGCAPSPPATEATSTPTVAPTPAAPSTAPAPSVPLDPATAVPGPVVEDASVVADRVAGLLWAGDARTDTTPADPARRAAAWLTPAALVQVTAAPAVDAYWLDLIAHTGRVLAAVQDVDDLVGTPPDTATTAVRVRGVALSAISEDGWTGPEQYVVATLHLTRAGEGDPWLVDQIEATWATTPAGQMDAG
jgi:hypothetical protein